MKRFLFILITLILGSFGFSETGYKNISWKTCLDDFIFQIDNTKYVPLSDTEKTVLGAPCLALSNVIQGEKNIIYLSGYLINKIFYQIDVKKIAGIKKNFPKPLEIIKTKTFVFENFKDVLEQDYGFEITEHLYDLALCIGLAENASMAESSGQKEMIDNLNSANPKGKNTGLISIYDYNDDTRVYIFENVLKDKAVVVYVPHEQDY